MMSEKSSCFSDIYSNFPCITERRNNFFFEETKRKEKKEVRILQYEENASFIDRINN